MPVIRTPDLPKRRRRPRLSTALAEARKAGQAVKGAEVRPDGSVALTFGAAESDRRADDEVESWVTKHAHKS